MANERIILCGEMERFTDADGKIMSLEREPVLLSLCGSHPTVNLKVRHICDPLAKILPGRFLDLIELATYVYCADQAVPRGGSGADVLGEDWRRTLRFAMPVAMVDMKLREPQQVTLGPDGLQRLFTSSGILRAEDVREILG